MHDEHTTWTKQAEANHEMSEDEEHLGLQMNAQGLLECQGRLQVTTLFIYLTTIPIQSRLQRMQTNVHYTGELVLQWREFGKIIGYQGWVAKRVIKQCFGCRQFQARAIAKRPPGNLPQDRTEEDRPFQAVGVDFAGPIMYRISKNTQGKAYALLYACSLMRMIYLELTKSMETGEFLQSLQNAW